MDRVLSGRKIVLGVSGGIAAYKAVELLRLLVQRGAEVRVVMTDNARQFVAPLTFETLSGHPVYHEIFGGADSASMEHIRAAEQADLLIVAPATANTLAKLAQGLADDPLSTLALAFSGTVLVAPAMNDRMWAHPAVQENVAVLARRGVTIIEPASGELACGVVGMGRLPEPETLAQAVEQALARGCDLAGLDLLVTAGPTREPLDPVRFITNHSSGKMGYAVARQAQKRGARVTLISGPTRLQAPHGVRLVACQRASEMRDHVLEELPRCRVLVMTAAVGDFAPGEIQKEKIKKQGEDSLELTLCPTPDILQEVARCNTGQFVVGFAAESQNVLQSAREKLARKKLDLIVANDISAPGIGFQSDHNQVTLVERDGREEALPRMTKQEIADLLLDRIRGRIGWRAE